MLEAAYILKKKMTNIKKQKRTRGLKWGYLLRRLKIFLGMFKEIVKQLGQKKDFELPRKRKRKRKKEKEKEEEKEENEGKHEKMKK